jgi:hypothetical protein
VVWIGVDIALAVIGLAVLAGCTVRLWRQVRQLGRDVGAAGARIAAASEDLARITPPGG